MPADVTEAVDCELEEKVGVVTVAFEGFTVGLIWYVSPTLSVILVSGSVTDVTGTLTVTVHDAVRAPLSLVAVITAVPSATATTLPFGSTLATLSLFDDHDTPLIDGLDGLYLIDRLLVAPAFKASVCLFTLIDVTGLASTLTVTVVSAFSSPLPFVTVIFTEPLLRPVTTPLLTVAIVSSDELHWRPDLSAL